MILLTGATGFVGSVVLRTLAKNYPKVQLIALRHRNNRAVEDYGRVRFLTSSLQALPLLKGELRGVKTIIHLAAKNIDMDGTGFNEVNVQGTKCLMDLAASIGVKRTIYLSSTGVYGHTAFLNAKETIRPRPDTPFSESKWQAEQIIHNYADLGMETMVLRHRFVIGTSDRYTLPRFVKAAQSLPFWLKKGRTCLSFIDVEDLAQIILRIALLSEWPSWLVSRPVLHVTNGEKITIRRLIEMITEAYTIRHKKRFNMPYWPLYAWALARERLLGIDPESKHAGSLSSVRLQFITQNNHFSNERLMRLCPDFRFKSTETTIRQFSAANPLSVLPTSQ